MTNGTVKFFNAAKGFGFITPDGNGKDVFVPAASVTASGVPGLKPGQRIAFDAEPDAKGPKAVNLKLLADAPAPKPTQPAPPPRREAPTQRLTVYVDPDTDESDDVLAALREAGHDPLVVDYITVPPARDDLKNLSLLLRSSDQSLVRKYDPLFRELYLDDRFISDNEFWTAIFEHPCLINGPVLANAHKARICRSANDVRAFLGLPVEAHAAAKSGAIPPRLVALVNGAATPAPVAQQAVLEKPEVMLAENASARNPVPAVKKPAPAIAAKVAAKPPVKPLAKAPAKPAAKMAAKSPAKAKPAKPAKKAAAKPVKKTRAKK